MVELLDGAVGPPEALGRVPQVAHDEAVLPAALARAGATQVGRRRGPVVHGAEPARAEEVAVSWPDLFVSIIKW